MPPAFLQRLGLDETCTERDIRRAYARALKDIDQERELEAFQSLRASYEAALYWVSLDQAAPADAAQTDASRKDAPQTDTSQRDASRPDTSRTDASQTDAAAELVLQIDPLKDAQQAFQLFAEQFGRLCRIDRPTFDSAVALLTEQLNSDHLLNTNARAIFEQLCAQVLAEGWRAGHELLLPACDRCFGWDNDRHLAARMGHAGAIMQQVLLERAEFNTLSNDLRQQMRTAIQRLRQSAEPEPHELATVVPAMEKMLPVFPAYLQTITDMHRFMSWQARWRNLRDAERQKLLRATSPSARKKRNFMHALALWAVVIVISNMARSCNTQSPSPYVPVPPSQELQDILSAERQAAEAAAWQDPATLPQVPDGPVPPRQESQDYQAGQRPDDGAGSQPAPTALPQEPDLPEPTNKELQAYLEARIRIAEAAKAAKAAEAAEAARKQEPGSLPQLPASGMFSQPYPFDPTRP